MIFNISSDMNYYYESNNIIVSLVGNSDTSLLVSSHFDSVSVSHGATDAGMGIASMVAAIQALSHKICTSPMDATLIFNFNNGEEIDMLGGYAFVRDPMFSNVKAFLNLGIMFLFRRDWGFF